MAKKHSAKFIAIVNEALTRIEEVNTDEIVQKLKNEENFELIDVRENEEFEDGHLPKARHLSKGIIERDIEETVPDTKREIVLYCGGGYRSVLAADNLRKMGYTNVKSLAGGWREWNEKGYPVE